MLERESPGTTHCRVNYRSKFRFFVTDKSTFKDETGNVKAYFSGHYQTYRINVQAVCDH